MGVVFLPGIPGNGCFSVCCGYIRIYFKINSTASIYIRRLIFLFFAFPVTRLMTTYEITPKEIPSEILYINGIAMMQINAGMASV